MNAREQVFIALATDELRLCGKHLLGQGWHTEIVVFGPEELERIPGYKVALVLSIDPPLPVLS